MKSRQSYILLFFFLFSSFVLFGQSVEDYQRGYKKGFQDGYCKAVSQCTAPYVSTSSIPYPGVNERNYADGYARGNADGSKRKAADVSRRKAADKKSENEREMQVLECSSFLVTNRNGKISGSKEIQFISSSTPFMVQIDFLATSQGGLLGNRDKYFFMHLSLKSKFDQYLYNDSNKYLDSSSQYRFIYRDGSQTPFRDFIHVISNPNNYGFLELGLYGDSQKLLDELTSKDIESIRFRTNGYEEKIDLTRIQSQQLSFIINCLVDRYIKGIYLN